MNSKQNTAQSFAVQFSALFSMYVVVIASISLVISVIDLLIFDPVDGPWQYERAVTSIRYSIALLVVSAPIHMIVALIQHRLRSPEDNVSYVTLTRWLVYLSFVVAGGVAAFQLVSVVLAFLEGALTARVILKALTIVVFVAAAVAYYYLDLQQYWGRNPARHRIAVGIYLLVVLVVIVLGAMTIQSPGEVRERALDGQQIQDMQEIRWRMDDHVRTEQVLPETVTDLYRRVEDAPRAPEGRPDYRYEILDADELEYQLCATFVHDSSHDTRDQPWPSALRDDRHIVDWSYEAGEWCFELSAYQEK